MANLTPHMMRKGNGSSDDLDELLWNNSDTVRSAIKRVNFDNNDPFTIHQKRVEHRTSVREIFPEPEDVTPSPQKNSLPQTENGSTPQKVKDSFTQPENGKTPQRIVRSSPTWDKDQPLTITVEKEDKLDRLDRFDKGLFLEKMTMTSDTDSIKKSHPRGLHFFQRYRCCFSFLNTEFDDLMSISFWKACLAEFFGTFLLCFFAIAMGLHKDGSPPPPLLQGALGSGLFLGVLISCLAAVSGGHVNPAVTVGFAVIREISLARTVCYIIFQCCGAVSGSMLLREITHENMVGGLGVIHPPEGIGNQQAIVVEMMITGFLVFVVMAHVDKGRRDIQGSVPFMVGLTIFANVLVGAPSSGGCMNPARALGPAVVMGDFQHQWIYWIAPLIGGALGSLLYTKVFAADASFKSMMVSCCKAKPADTAEYRSLLKNKEREKISEDNICTEIPMLEKAPETNV
ncbi:aquaporin-5-like [Physella acuta]|uniref:aquaporin-5-like n=1 Tax=Physella acuta TaxID=109671 RepID=UPI0027DAC361|nr:aquaporin-5-like [Physella acuta]